MTIQSFRLENVTKIKCKNKIQWEFKCQTAVRFWRLNQGDFYFRQQTAPGIIIIGITTAYTVHKYKWSSRCGCRTNWSSLWDDYFQWSLTLNFHFLRTPNYHHHPHHEQLLCDSLASCKTTQACGNSPQPPCFVLLQCH